MGKENAMKIVAVIKPVGKTPLWAVERFKALHSTLKNETVSYAGRLDPMAEGLLLLLVGEENKNRKAYENLPKTYLTEIVLGLSTDTFDALGIVDNINNTIPKKKEVEESLKRFIGIQQQLYPPYSSKTVSGKPLFWWARNNKLSEIKLPKRNIEITKIEMQSYKKISLEKLHPLVEERIKNVEGNFRQETILAVWEEIFKRHTSCQFIVAKFEIDCSTGTYIRRFASDLGKRLTCSAFCLSIKRTRIGDFNYENALQVE